MCSGDWLLLGVMRGIFNDGLDTGRVENEEEEEATGVETVMRNWTLLTRRV